MKTQRLALLSLLSISASVYIPAQKKKALKFRWRWFNVVATEWEFKENKDYKVSIDTAYHGGFRNCN